MAPNAPSTKAGLHLNGANQPHYRGGTGVVAGLFSA